MPEVWNEYTQSVDVKFPYRSKWACFSCRKSFTRHVEFDGLFNCPNCQKLTIDMGYLFETPKKSDDKSWRIASELADANLRFNSMASVAYINHRITHDGKASISDVRHNIKTHKLTNN